ncbi:MAG: hypothetical protein JWQ40_3883 [Segetibacter sp.]|jgi:hypothetical protein|nr:hypothetical protein [Segetibacter sp.]
MKRKAFYLIFAILLYGVYSCQKEFVLTDADTHAAVDTTGNSTPPVVVTPAFDSSYQPLTKGSFWKYRDSADKDMSLHTALDVMKTINGKIYTAVLASDSTSTDSVYFAHDSINYYMYTLEDTSSFTFNYYNDTAKIGKSWDYTSGNGSSAIRLRTTVISRKTNLTVNNTVYKNVVHSQVQMTTLTSGTFTPQFIFDYYLAKGVGLIKARTKGVGPASGILNTEELTEYSIK